MDMVKYFYHSPSSTYPIPDILGESNDKNSNKTEYHPITKTIIAENWLKECMQRNIKKFAKDGKYLFWVTRCQNKSMDAYDTQFIVGYMKKYSVMERPTIKEGIHVGTHSAVIGIGAIYTFDDAVPTKEVFGRSINRPILIHKPFLTEEQTSSLLKHFSTKKSCLEQCIQEISLLDKEKKTCWIDGCNISRLCTRNVLSSVKEKYNHT